MIYIDFWSIFELSKFWVFMHFLCWNLSFSPVLTQHGMFFAFFSYVHSFFDQNCLLRSHRKRGTKFHFFFFKKRRESRIFFQKKNRKVFPKYFFYFYHHTDWQETIKYSGICNFFVIFPRTKFILGIWSVNEEYSWQILALVSFIQLIKFQWHFKVEKHRYFVVPVSLNLWSSTHQ